MNDPEARVLVLTTDLLFTSKISGTAQSLKVPSRTVPSTQRLVASVGPQTLLAIVDLGLAEVTPADLRAIRQALPAGARLVAYGSHVDAERLRAAQEAGCDEVLPRSRFVDQLAAILRSAAP